MKLVRLMLSIVGLVCLSCSLSANTITLDAQLKQISASPLNATSFEVFPHENNVEINANRPLVPASTLKILTAFLAMERWGGASLHD